MKKIDTARALRDPEYRDSLSAAERAQLPAHPAGLSTVADDTLESITGGCDPATTFLTSCVGPNEACP